MHVNHEKRQCTICRASKPLSMFNSRSDGIELKTICRICEIKRNADRKARGVRACHDCGKPTINYRCASCWRELCGINPLKANIDDSVNEILL